MHIHSHKPQVPDTYGDNELVGEVGDRTVYACCSDELSTVYSC